MKTPRVTVLMPVYNGAKFLSEAMESILVQSFTDFEFLIIDDASTDTSVALIETYKDPRIRLIRNPENMGISATLNKGISLASAGLIARMDADDISYPERLQKQVDFFDAHADCVFVSTWARIVDQGGIARHTERYNLRFYYYNMTFSCWIYHPTVMYKKSAVVDAGGYRSTYAEDYDLFWQMQRRYRLHHLEEVLLDYRVTDQSLHQVLKKKEYDDAMLWQIGRNIRYYAGDAVLLDGEEMDFLRFDVEGILRDGRLSKIVGVFRKLRVITEKILESPNPNLVKGDVEEAWYYRRRHMLKQVGRGLSWPKVVGLRLALMFWRV